LNRYKTVTGRVFVNSSICEFMCETENLPRLLKEIMQEAKRLTDAEWCVFA